MSQSALNQGRMIFCQQPCLRYCSFDHSFNQVLDTFLRLSVHSDKFFNAWTHNTYKRPVWGNCNFAIMWIILTIRRWLTLVIKWWSASVHREGRPVIATEEGLEMTILNIKTTNRCLNCWYKTQWILISMFPTTWSKSSLCRPGHLLQPTLSIWVKTGASVSCFGWGGVALVNFCCFQQRFTCSSTAAVSCFEVGV